MAHKRTKGRKLQAAPVEGDWLSQLAENLELQPAPPGWYTLTQVAQYLKIGRTATRRILAEKKAARQKFYHKTIDGRIVPTMHYKL
jgi:hypothetical protein